MNRKKMLNIKLLFIMCEKNVCVPCVSSLFTDFLFRRDQKDIQGFFIPVFLHRITYETEMTCMGFYTGNSVTFIFIDVARVVASR